MSKLKWYILCYLAVRIVRQGGHRERIIQCFRVIREAAQEEFREENELTTDSFIVECFDEAMNLGDKRYADDTEEESACKT